MAGAPKLMFTMRMLYLTRLSGFVELTAFVGSAGLMIQFMAASNAEVVPVPCEFNTRRLITVAPGATPS